MEQNLKPTIRFRRFSEPWIVSDFRSTFDMLKNNSLSRDFLNYEGGILRNVHYGDVLIKYDEVLDAKRDVIPYITDDEVASKFKHHCLVDGDIIFADTAEDSTTGKCVEIRNIGHSAIVSGLHTIACRPKYDFSEGYLGYYLNSDSFHSQLLRIMQGTKVVSISKGSIVDIIVRYPQNTDEQAQIGALFNRIVDMLREKKTELEKLENVKNACVERMFPREGETAPQLRFKGFSDDWKASKIEKIGEPITTSTLGYADLSENGKYPCILYGELYTKYAEIIENIISRTDVEATFLRRNDILFPTSTTVDAISLIAPSCMNDDFAVAGGDMFIIRPYAEIDGSFVSYTINNVHHIKSALAKKAQGLTIVHLHYNNIKDVTILLPSIDEQRKISAYFRHLDELIAAKRQEIEKLQNIKQSLLDKMFV